MITVSIDPIILSIGHFAIRWYSLILVTAIGVGAWVASREARRRGLDPGVMTDALAWVVVAGMIGARLFHVIDHWPDEYAANPLRALYVWEGGLAIWGGVVGGLAALAGFAWRRGLRIGLLADVAAPGLVLGQAIGRVACIITGDAVGKPTNGPFGFAYTQPGAMVPRLGEYYIPTQVYEILMNLGIFAVIWRLRERKLPEGGLFLTYLLLYSAGRSIVTFWSSYRVVALGLNQAQIISILAFSIGLPCLIYLLGPRWLRRSAVI